MLRRKLVALSIMVFFLCTITSSTNVALAVADDGSVYDDVFKEKENWNNVSDEELLYKKYPIENYSWDTTLKFIEWQGIKPVINDPTPIMDNSSANMVRNASINLTRFAIYVFQTTYEMNFIEVAVNKIAGKLDTFKNQFYNYFFPLFSLVLLAVVGGAYARGQKGLAVKHVFLSMALVAIISGVIANISFFVLTAKNVTDTLSAYVIGTVNLAPFTEDEADVIAKKRIITLTNQIWNANVDKVWQYGAFGGELDPIVTNAEKQELFDEYDIEISVGQQWRELLLTHGPGSEERVAFVSVLTDKELNHDVTLKSQMFREVGSVVRSFISGLALVTSILTLILFVIIGAILVVSSIATIILIAFMPVIVPFPLLANVGYNIVKKYFLILLASLAIVVAASFYLGLLLLAMYVTTLLDLEFTDMMIVYIIVFLVGIICSPIIWKIFAPFVIKVATGQYNPGFRDIPGTSRSRRNNTDQGSEFEEERERVEEVTSRPNYGRNRRSSTNFASSSKNEERSTEELGSRKGQLGTKTSKQTATSVTKASLDKSNVQNSKSTKGKNKETASESIIKKEKKAQREYPKLPIHYYKTKDDGGDKSSQNISVSDQRIRNLG